MEIQYLCPKCKSFLNVTENIIISFKSEIDSKQGIVLLRPELGDYDFIMHNTVNFIKNEKVEFFCPICYENLKVPEINENLVKILMVDENNKEFDIFFSRIVSEQSTFKIRSGDIIEKFGKDSSSYLDYFSKKLADKMKHSKEKKS